MNDTEFLQYFSSVLQTVLLRKSILVFMFSEKLQINKHTQTI